MKHPVEYVHYRILGKDGVSSRGGATLCLKETPDGIDAGYTLCSVDDNFNKRIGRTRAWARASTTKRHPYQMHFGSDAKFHDIVREAEQEIRNRYTQEVLRKRVKNAGVADFVSLDLNLVTRSLRRSN